MPGADGSADDLESMIAEVAGEQVDTGTNTPADNANPTLDALRPSSAQAANQANRNAEAQKVFGKYSNLQEAEKAHKSLVSELGKKGSKLGVFEKLLTNPKFAELAKSDPDIAQALGKAGYQTALEKEQAEGGITDPRQVDWERDPIARAELSDAKNELRWELFELKTELKDHWSPDVERQVRTVISRIGDISAREAFKLTPIADQIRKDAEDRRVKEAIAKLPQTARPKPKLPGSMGAEKVDMKKPVTQFNSAEKRAFLENLPQ